MRRNAGTTGGAGTTGTAGTTGGAGSTAGHHRRRGTTGSGGMGGSPGICGSNAAPPAHYQHVVIFSFENRTWSRWASAFGRPRCRTFIRSPRSARTSADWTETNTGQNSLTQYIGETSGVSNPNTVNDCNPSTTCRSTDDNIFRQVRVAGGHRAQLRRGRDHRLLGERQRRQAHPRPLLLRDVHGRHREPQRPRLLQHRGPALQRIRRQQPADLRVHHADPVQRRPRLQRRDRRRLGAAPTSSASSTAPPTRRARWRSSSGTTKITRCRTSTSRRPRTRASITQIGVGTHAALLKTIEDLLGVPFMNQGQLPGATDLRSFLGM